MASVAAALLSSIAAFYAAHRWIRRTPDPE